MPEDDIDKILAKHSSRFSGGGGDGGGSWNPLSTEEATTGAGAFGKGVIQGGLGYLEAPAQLAEQGIRKVTGNEQFKLPLHDWASAYKRGVESSTAGNVGEMVGSAVPMFLPAGWIGAAGRGASLAARGLRGAEEIPSFLGAAGKGAEAVSQTGSKLVPELAKGAAGAALSQPVSGDDFAHEKLQQMIAGAMLSRLAGQVGRKFQYPHAEEIAAREAGFSGRSAQKAAQSQAREEFSRSMDEAASSPYPPAWAKARAKAKEERPWDEKAKDLGAHLISHYALHGLPLGMFARWHAARTLSDLIRHGRIPGLPPELRARLDRLHGRVPYNPGAIPYVAGAQYNRFGPPEDGEEEAQ